MSEILPGSWATAQFGELSENFDSKRIPVKSKDRAAMFGEFPYYGASGIIDHVNEFIFDGTYLLVAEDGANLLSRSTPIAFRATGKFWVNNHAHVTRSVQGVSMLYVEYFLNSLDLRLYITGTAQPKLTQNNLNKIPISLPPISEQKRIVEKLEQLLSELDKAVDSLKAAQEKLKTYRRAVLKAAVEGELSREWREANRDRLEPADKLLERILVERRKKWEEAELEKMRAKGLEPKDNGWKAKYQEPAAPNLNSLSALPESWIWAALEQVSDVTGGLTKNPRRAALPQKLPYIRVANVYADELKLDDIEEIGVVETELHRVLLQNNDLLIVEGNGSPDQIGRVALWENQIEPCVHQNHIIKARFYKSGFERFAIAWFLSLGGRESIRNVASSTSGLYTLSISKVSSLPLPLAPQEEMSYIVEKLDEELSYIDDLEITLRKNLVRHLGLRQSILQKAFSGQLVPQDPNDEPASVLLERICAEREAQGAQDKRGKKKTKATESEQPRLLEVDA